MSSAELILHGPAGRLSRELPPERLDQPLTEHLRRAGIALNTRCGERRLCQGCLVELRSGTCLSRSTGAILEVAEPRTHRACDLLLLPGHALEVAIPHRSLLAHAPQVVTSFRLNVPWTHDPLWQAVDPASCRGAADRVPPGAGPGSLAYIRPRWEFTPGPTPARPLGAAIDLGTTTVVVVVVDLADGRVLGQASALNAQAPLGDNVITRINLCLQDPGMIASLHRAVVDDSLGPLLREALAQVPAEPDQLRVITVAGNTTMQHLLVGCDPGPMGRMPFQPKFLESRTLTTADLGLDWPSPTPPAVHVLPGASAYVGADIVAGVLSTGLAYSDRPGLLVDLGTNGEMVLRAGDHLWGCATAAGPAFEGAGLLHGVRAGAGAIAHVWPTTDDQPVRVEVIGGSRPLGICGTAYVDFLARGRRIGLLSPTGRFQHATPTPHLARDAHGWSYALAPGRSGESLRISEADLASLLQAKAAIAAGVECLLQRARLTPADIATVFLAGGFGFHMHVDSLFDCGLLPGFQADQIALVGNSSLAGAFAALLDSSFLDELESLRSRIEILELNLEPDFESRYIEHLGLP